MDKDRFRELLQSFEQLSVKPEAGRDPELDDISFLPEPKLRRVSSSASVEPCDISSLVEAARDLGASFPELQSTHPLPDHQAFQANDALQAIASGPCGRRAEEMRAQQQLHTASRFRLVAGLMAQLWFQADSVSRDKMAGKGVRAKMAAFKDDLLAICSASLVEAGQVEAQAQEAAPELPATPDESTPSRSSTADRALSTDSASCLLDKSCSLEPEDIALGARISRFASIWPAITTDAWVLRTVTDGLRFDFAAEPQSADVADPEYALEESTAIEKVIRWDLGDKVIEEIPYRPELLVSHMYTLPIGGRLKALVEFRVLNKFLEAGSIEVKETPSLASLLRKNDWITRINIKCAYPSVPIHPDHRKYLVFKYDGRYYQYRALPFGISVASRAFTRLLQAALQPLRDEGFRITTHIDELCLVHSSYPALAEQTQRLCRHLTALGFLINTNTSDLVPQQNQRFLGFVYNTIEGTVQFPRDQIKKVRRAAHNSRSSAVTAKQLAALLGKIRSIMPAVGPEPRYIREIEGCLEAAITAPDAWDSQVCLSAAALGQINWLCETILTKKSMLLDA